MVNRDGYSSFNGLVGDDKTDEMVCMEHFKREFVDVFASQGNDISEQASRWIPKLLPKLKDARGKVLD